MARESIRAGGIVTLDAGAARKPPLPAPDSIEYALRDAKDACCSGMRRLPAGRR